MIPWSLVDTAAVPGGAAALRLMRRGTEYSILLGSTELMNSRRGGSETALAEAACARLVERGRPRVLIGGLGMGFTLRAALNALGPAASVCVAELVPGVVAWARGPLAPLFAGSLDDARVTLVEDDVGALIAGAAARYDAILLDVDNGPAGQSRAANDRLYEPGGLAAAWQALRPGGLLAVWSEAGDPAFVDRLRRAGFTVDELRARSGGRRGARHVVWLANRPDAAHVAASA